MISGAKIYEKYLKSKNDIKRPLGPFNKELWATQVFLKPGKFLKPSTHGEKRYNNQQNFLIFRLKNRAIKELTGNFYVTKIGVEHVHIELGGGVS